jgi:hypothetical protein
MFSNGSGGTVYSVVLSKCIFGVNLFSAETRKHKIVSPAKCKLRIQAHIGEKSKTIYELAFGALFSDWSHDYAVGTCASLNQRNSGEGKPAAMYCEPLHF